MSVRVLVVDDHPLFLDGVRAALSGVAGIEVVGEAHDKAGAVARAADLHPDVVLMDLNLPDGSGIDAVRELAARLPEARVLVMTMSTDDDAVVAAMRAGARGYVVKGAGRRDLVESVRAVAAGGAVFSPVVADRLAGYFTGLAAVPGREAFPQLTEREREVLELLADGLTTAEVAERLSLSEHTVRSRVKAALGKLGARNREHAIAIAIREGAV